MFSWKLFEIFSRIFFKEHTGSFFKVKFMKKDSSHALSYQYIVWDIRTKQIVFFDQIW